MTEKQSEGIFIFVQVCMRINVCVGKRVMFSTKEVIVL